MLISVFKHNIHFFIVLYSTFYCINFGIKIGIRCLDFFNKKVQKQTFTLMVVKLRVLSLQLVFLSINKELRVSKIYQKICTF